MTTSKNDITGDELKSKVTTKSYEEGWERIFGNKKEKEKKNKPEKPSKEYQKKNA